MLTLEFERIPKKEEIDKQLTDLNQDTEVLKVDIAQRAHEKGNLLEELKTRQADIALYTKMGEESDREEALLKV